PGPLREDADGALALQHLPRGDQGLLVRLAAADGIRAQAIEDPPLPAALEELDLGDVVERAAPRKAGADHEGVEEAAVGGGDDQRPTNPPVLAADPRQAQVDEEAGLEDRPGDDVERAVHAVLPREAVVPEEGLLVHSRLRKHAGGWPVTCLARAYQAASRIAT